MNLRLIQGQTAVRGLYGDSWVYLSAGKGSLRVVNVPGWVTEEDVAASFKGIEDRVSGIYITDNISRNRVRIATVSIDDDNVVKNILKAPGKQLTGVECVPDETNNVLSNWMREYTEERDIEAVRAWANSTMEAYESREQRIEEARRKRREEGPDDDGFQLVVDGFKRTKMNTTSSTTTGSNSNVMIEVGNGKRIAVSDAHIEKDGFYRWQKKNKLSDIDGLRKRFDQDKKRVAAAAALKLNQ